MVTIVEFLVSHYILIHSIEDSMLIFFQVMAIARKIASEENIESVTQEKMDQYRELMQREIDENILLPNFP